MPFGNHGLETVPLEDGEVHLWLLSPTELLDLSAWAAAAGGPEIPGADAWRFRDPQTRRRWEGRTVALRLLLGRYGAVPDGRGPGESGMPSPAGVGASPVLFSDSASEGWWLAAVSGAGVGVDVECPQEDLDYLAFADRWFTPEERVALTLEGGPEACRRDFYRHWTRRRARRKLLQGGGIVSGPGRSGPDVWIEDLALRENLLASLAMERPPSLIRRMAWTDPKSGSLSAGSAAFPSLWECGPFEPSADVPWEASHEDA